MNFLKGLLFGLKSLLIGFGMIFFLIFLLFFVGIGMAIVRSGNTDVANTIVKSDKQVAVIQIANEIGDEMKAVDFQKQLLERLRDASIKGVVVRIDSPGGSVGESEEIYMAIKNARKQFDKKHVVCSLGNVAASGGLYVAMACEKIVTLKGTITGSIGVMMISPNFSGILQKYDVSINVVKSGQYKDAGSPFRAMTEEDKMILSGNVDTAFEQFVSVITDNRNLSREDVLKFADGRIILGEDAVKLKLADYIGNINTAGDIALELAGIQGNADLIYPRKDKWNMVLNRLAESRLGWWLKSVNVGTTLEYKLY